MRTRTTVVGLVAVLGLMVGCGGSDDGSSSGSATGGFTETTDVEQHGDAAEGTAGTTGTGTRTGARAAPQTADASALTMAGANRGTSSALTDALPGRDLVLNATLHLRVRDVAAAAQAAERAAIGADGFVATEEVLTDPDNAKADSARLTLRVPVSAYEVSINRLSRLGTRLSAHRATKDVTERVVDTQSRLSTARASVARVRTLLARAETLGQVVQLESELTRRQSDLESLQGRLASLRRQVDLATIDVTLSAEDAPAAANTDDTDGFLGGLESGWGAFTRTGTAVLTAVGAVLPFAAVVALLAALALAARRRRSPAAVEEAGNPG